MQNIVEHVKEAVQRERAEQRRVTELDEVPGNYNALTTEWLSKVMCRDTPGAKIEDFALGEPDNGATNRRRISLSYNQVGTEAGLPATVFCKAATSAATRTTLAACGGSQAEANFYNKVQPRLDFQTPVTYYAGFDPESFALFIMMKDVGDRVIFPDKRHLLTREQAEAMVDTLARLHARFYNSPELGSETLPFTRWDKWWSDQIGASPDFARCCDEAFGSAEHIMPARLYKRRAEIWPKTMASAQAHAHLPCGLAHGDVHLKNFFITSEERMGLHDWAIANVGHWSRDYIYATTAALTVENRRAWEQDLLRIYLDKMEERGVPRVSVSEAMHNCRQQLMTAVAFWNITLNPAPEMADMQPETTSWTFLKRFYAAIDDHDALDAFDI